MSKTVAQHLRSACQIRGSATHRVRAVRGPLLAWSTPLRKAGHGRAATALLLSVLSVPGLAAAAAALPPVAGEVIVQFKPGAAVLREHAMPAQGTPMAVRAVLAARAAATGARLGFKLEAGVAGGERAQTVRATGVDTATLIEKLAADPDVEYAVPNGRRRHTAAPNDPLYPTVATGTRPGGPDSGQWYLHAPAASIATGPVSSIDITTAWARTLGRTEIVVAVIDNGVRPEHPDLQGRLLPGYDFVSNALVGNDGQTVLSGDDRDADPSDPGDWISLADTRNTTFADCSVENSSWHGTGTTSLVGAATSNGIGMAGAAPGVGLLPVRVLGKCFGTDIDIVAGMRWAAGIAVPGAPVNPNPAKVLNLSLGAAGSCSAAYQAAVDDVLATGAVVVAAGGNSAGGPVAQPANCKGVLGVLALRHSGLKVGFSDLGPEIAIAAPGGNCVNVVAGQPCLYPILTATNSGLQVPVASGWTNSYLVSLGTSFAAPQVAATAGLMLSMQPALSPAQLRALLQSSARPFPTTGGVSEDGSVVPQCVPPTPGVEQLQCYCNTAVCGAGMLDAGAAVNEVSKPVARITLVTAQPTVGDAVSLSAEDSLAAGSASVVAWQWTLTDSGGIVTGFGSATNASTATLTPTAAGSFTVTLSVTDSRNVTGQVSLTITVASAPTPPPPVADSDSGGGGGGATAPGWIAALGLAVAALFGARAARRGAR